MGLAGTHIPVMEEIVGVWVLWRRVCIRRWVGKSLQGQRKGGRDRDYCGANFVGTYLHARGSVDGAEEATVPKRGRKRGVVGKTFRKNLQLQYARRRTTKGEKGKRELVHFLTMKGVHKQGRTGKVPAGVAVKDGRKGAKEKEETWEKRTKRQHKREKYYQ